jgi:prepilin-type N-terminal cleavage/methylation domain-containing protein
MPRHAKAFSLIEVVAAVAIFAIGMVAVLGLFAPITKSVSVSADAETAARLADAARARLSSLPFATAAALIQDATAVQKNDADGSYNPNDGKHPAVIFGKLNGEIGIYDAANGRKDWRDSADARVADADKFFEIDLIRNAALSPATDDAAAPLIAYNVRVRWPAFQPASSGAAVQVGASPGTPVPFDPSRKQVLFFTGFITR